MQGRADVQKRAKSVASGGRPERPPRPLAGPHAGPAGRHRHPTTTVPCLFGLLRRLLSVPEYEGSDSQKLNYVALQETW